MARMLVLAAALVLSLSPGLAAAQSTGAITGTVTDAATGAPLDGVQILVYAAAGDPAGQSRTNYSGVYVVSGLAAGTYYVRTSVSAPYVNKLYNDMPCPIHACAPTTGTPVSVSAGATREGVNFSLVTGGTITGIVSAAATGAPLANVHVQAYTTQGALAGINGTTDASGTYTITWLETGSYFLKTSYSFPYVDELYDDVPCPGGYCEVTAGTGVSVTAGSSTAHVNIALTQGATITGTVTAAATGAPLPGIRVDVYNENGASNGWNVTDEAGAYSVTGLKTGTYYVATSNGAPYSDELYNNLPCQQGSCAVASGTAILATAGETRAGIDFALSGGGTITGTVTDAMSGAPLANIPVMAHTPDGTKAGETVSGSSGQFAIADLTTGKYHVRTRQAFPHLDEVYDNLPCPSGSCAWTLGTDITVAAGATTGGINLALTKGGMIKGVVTDAVSLSPLAGIDVVCYDSSGLQAGSATTDASGSYTIEGLQTGTYFLQARHSPPYAGELYNNLLCPSSGCTVTSGTGVSVTAGSTVSGINFSLAVTGTIAGRVTASKTGAPIANMAVIVSTGSRETAGVTSTDASGAYSVSNVAPGTYFVRTGSSPPYWAKLYDNISCHPDCDVTQGTGVVVSSAVTTANINFALDQTGTIAGAVTNASSGAPLANVTVTAYLATGMPAGQTVTDASGSYSIPFLDPGAYYVRTMDGYPYLDELYNDKPCPGCPINSGNQVMVNINQATEGINFGLTLGGSITGSVTDAGSGAPIANIEIQLYDSYGRAYTSRSTDALGIYTIGGLPAGTYYLTTRFASPYVDKLYNNLPCLGGSCTITSGTPVTVTAASQTTGINFALFAGAAITGTVTEATTGLPLANVGVEVYNGGGTLAGQTTTNASGAYAFAGLGTGTHYLRTWNTAPFVDELYNNLPCTATDCVVTSGTGVNTTVGVVTPNINFTLSAGGTISGRVTDAASGRPIARVRIVVVNADGFWAGHEASSSADGTYVVPVLATGTWYVHASAGRPYTDVLYKDVLCHSPIWTPTDGTGVSVVAGAPTTDIDFAMTAAIARDFDGDHRSDILWRHSERGEIWLWPMDGGQHTAESFVRRLAEPGWEIRGQGDQTGDGRADILWRHGPTGMVYLWAMKGSTVEAETYVGTVEPAYDIVGTGDYNGDGKTDILWRHLTNGQLWMWLMDGPTTLSVSYVDTVDPAYVVQGSGDLNGDGKADIVWRHATAGDVWVWVMDGATPQTVAYVTTVSELAYRIVGVADHTGDGRADLLWHHDTRGEVWLWQMNGTTLVSQTYVDTVADTGYRIVGNGDYDGDGKADILWHHNARGEVWAWLMNGAVKLSENYVATVPEVQYQIANAK